MKTFLFTSELFTGHVLFRYNATGYLLTFDCSQATLEEKYYRQLIKLLPFTIEMLRANFTHTKYGTLTLQVKKDITFEEFWPKVYINKGSSKKVSLKVWERMNQPNRDAAFNYWDKYIDNKPQGEGIKYVETYLRSEIWNN